MRYAASKREAAVSWTWRRTATWSSIDEMAAYAVAHSGWTASRSAVTRWARRREQLVAAGVADAPDLGARRRASPGRVQPAGLRPGGRHIGTPDLLDPEAGVVGEYDGAAHLARRQRRRDREREDAFRPVGLEYFTMVRGTSATARRRGRRMDEARGRAALRRPTGSARLDGRSARPGGSPTITVDQRRGLDDRQQRDRLLGYRAVTA